MSSAVRKYKRYFVEARFGPGFTIILMLVMRTGLFLVSGVAHRSIPDTSFVWRYIAPFISDQYISFALSTVSILIIAMLLLQLNNHFSLLRNRSNMAFIVPLFIFSLHPIFLEMRPDFVAIIIILCAFYPLLDSYQQEETQIYSFKSGVLIALAALFQVFALLIIPFWWRGEFSMRNMNFKSIASTLFGMALVFWSLFGFLYLVDDLDSFTKPFLYLTKIAIPDIPISEVIEWIEFMLVAVIFLVFRYFLSRSYSRDKVQTQLVLHFMVLLAVAFIFIEAIYWELTFFPFIFSITLISFPLAYFYSTITSKWGVRGFYALLSFLVIFYLVNFFNHLYPI